MEPNQFVNQELADMMFGEFIGQGMSRSVYQHRFYNDLVFKIEDLGSSKIYEFQNAVEWQNWNFIQHSAIEKYFAPCRKISDNGKILIQERVEPILKIPKNFPRIFNDMRLCNFGKYKGRVVLCDYGYGGLDVPTLCKKLKRWKAKLRRKQATD
jgi:hypothetical protein